MRDTLIRAKTASGRQARVCEAVGVRSACLALAPLAKNGGAELIKAIEELGSRADEFIMQNDGLVLQSFKDALERILSPSGDKEIEK